MGDFKETFEKVKDHAAIVGRELGKIFEDVGARAGEFIDQTKLAAGIREQERQLECLYAEVGRAVYSAHTDGTESNLDNLYADIAAKVDAIATLKVALDELKKVHRCHSCGREVEKEVKFCPGCGAEQ